MKYHENLFYNPTLCEMEEYASKVISRIAKNSDDVIGLSFGEPEFGPPSHLLDVIRNEDLTLEAFLDSVKRYEDSSGSIELRQAISSWYERYYSLNVDSNKEVMVTHGGVEAITLSILSVTNVGDGVLISSPSYMLYARAITSLGRVPIPFERDNGDKQYLSIDKLTNSFLLKNKVKAVIINSPENPSGYVLGDDDWQVVEKFILRNNLWLIHDEVYDRMDYSRPHTPAISMGMRKNCIMINSFSKKYGMPGLRIGWIVAGEGLLELAKKAHDYHYLGVNIHYQRIATRLLNADLSVWFRNISLNIQERAEMAMRILTEKDGFIWDRKPMGAMFLFPNVSELYERIPQQYKLQSISKSVANYLIQERRVAVVPGIVYGEGSDNYIRIVLCTSQFDFEEGIRRLRWIF